MTITIDPINDFINSLAAIQGTSSLADGAVITITVTAGGVDYTGTAIVAGGVWSIDPTTLQDVGGAFLPLTDGDSYTVSATDGTDTGACCGYIVFHRPYGYRQC